MKSIILEISLPNLKDLTMSQAVFFKLNMIKF